MVIRDREISSDSTSYVTEHVDQLPFNTPEKSDRYRTERYQGAIGLNWYTSDPTIQFLMRYHLTPDELAWLEPHLVDIGELMGGPVAIRADQTDKNPPRLERYDRWGHEVSHVHIPESAKQTKRDIFERGMGRAELRQEAQRAGVRLGPASSAQSYMLNQAEVGMTCALGADAGMVGFLASRYAPPDVREIVVSKLASGEWAGKTAQLLTERTGGSDLAEIETTATPHGDAWLLNGFKWFASNCDGEAYVVLAKPEGAPDNIKSTASFLVLKQRRDGSRNGVRIRQLKDKLGTKAVASGEVEFVDAEAFLMAGDPQGEGHGDTRGAGDGSSMSRMMMLTNAARYGIAMMGLGCARRALAESLCYTRARHAWGHALIDQPLMRRKLAEMIVDVEAAQAMVFDGGLEPNQRRNPTAPRSLRLGAPLTKLRCARLGITSASDAIEIHGGNGYIETWPVARILRDAQVNTLWEGPDNILCLDVRRGIEREGADEPLLERIREAIGNGDDSDPTTRLLAERADDLAGAIAAWKHLDRTTAEARLYPLAQFMIDVYSGALLCEQAGWEREELGTDRKTLVAQLHADRYLTDRGRLRGIDADPSMAMARFSELADGALVDNRS
jgi:alkylation response protein AidB-like acyl-CoA dehydrogenase